MGTRAHGRLLAALEEDEEDEEDSSRRPEELEEEEEEEEEGEPDVALRGAQSVLGSTATHGAASSP